MGCAAIAITAPARAAPPALSPASSAELQKLLEVPNAKLQTAYDDQKLPRVA